MLFCGGLLLALLYNFEAFALSPRPVVYSAVRMSTGALRLLNCRNLLQRNCLGKYRCSYSRRVSLYAVATDDGKGSIDLNDNDKINRGRKEAKVPFSSYTYENLPEETLYVMDGTSMIFTAHYRYRQGFTPSLSTEAHTIYCSTLYHSILSYTTLYYIKLN